MAKKLLVIVGVTGTGKTKLGIHLAKKFDGEIISADSRQVYKNLDIGTNKEWGDAPIYGYDLVGPDKNFSVSEFVKFARNKISEILKRNKLPILVGGTGFYIKAVVDGFSTVNIPKNEELRKTLDKYSVNELFEKLATIDSSRAANMNSSDKKNPRRLIRAIEIAIWALDNRKRYQNKKVGKDIYKPLIIGLISPDSLDVGNVKKRIEYRINNGFIDEVEGLLKSGVGFKNQSMQSIGYKDSEKFFKGQVGYEEFIDSWVKNEIAYIKRQTTWFKKDNRINWFNTSFRHYPKNIENKVKKWYNSNII